MDAMVLLRKLQASMLKVAFEEGWNEGHSRDCTYHPEFLKEDWENSQAKTLYDKMMVEDTNVKTNMAGS